MAREKTMMYLNLILFFAGFYLSCESGVHCCQKIHSLSGYISREASSSSVSDCWTIEVPKDRYVTLNLVRREFHGLSCSEVYVKIEAAVTKQVWKYCSYDDISRPVTALNDVTIVSRQVYQGGWTPQRTSFKIIYNIEDIVCTQKDNFRCSPHSCIHKEKVCDLVNDCEDGRDENGCGTGVTAVKGVNVTREQAITWLKGEREVSYGWGKETHRAITALYLAGAAHFHEDNLEEELMAKQLELQTSVALLRNSTDILSASDISMFINALKVTCHNPRNFYGYDLLQILYDKIDASKYPLPGAYLTLCNANWTLSEKHIHNILRLLTGPSEYPFVLEYQAMAMMALTCIQKVGNFENVTNTLQIYNETTEKFIKGQQSDGSFGNIYTTAVVTQALIAAQQEENKLWNLNATVQYLMHRLSASKDLISVYLTLPVLNSKSLVDIAEVKCKKARKKREDAEIEDLRNKLGGKMRIKYSLYVGDNKDVIHTIYMRAPEGSTVYDIMRLAEIADHKYKFSHRKMGDDMYIYKIAGITNDLEAGKFWLLYIQEDPDLNGTMHHHTKSPDKITLEDEENLIMWYKTALV